ncbi:hypothetical protein Trydic_g22732 [Trypoxylus dichotomus]
MYISKYQPQPAQIQGVAKTLSRSQRLADVDHIQTESSEIKHILRINGFITNTINRNFHTKTKPTWYAKWRIVVYPGKRKPVLFSRNDLRIRKHGNPAELTFHTPPTSSDQIPGGHAGFLSELGSTYTSCHRPWGQPLRPPTCVSLRHSRTECYG